MKDFFKESDFSECFRWNDQYGSPNEAITATANAKLNELIESAPVVYGNTVCSWSHKLHAPVATHKARVIFIEEIVKEPCKHEPEFVISKNGIIKLSKPVPYAKDIYEESFFEIKCQKCGVELTVEWREKNGK